MRVAITGGAGFVGHAVVRKLRERGDQVVALVRDIGRAPHLAELGVELVPDDLVAAVHEPADDTSADESGGTRDDDSHGATAPSRSAFRGRRTPATP